jgi:hypothetical protein
MSTNSTSLSRERSGSVRPAGEFVPDRLKVVAVCVGALMVCYFWAGHVRQGPVLCPLHGLLGLPCPACGLTRAFCALTHGNVPEALRQNALSLPVFGLFLAAPVVAVYELLRRRRCTFYAFLYSTRVAYVAGTVVVLYAVGRLAYLIVAGRLFDEYIKTSWTYWLLH